MFSRDSHYRFGDILPWDDDVDLAMHEDDVITITGAMQTLVWLIRGSCEFYTHYILPK